MMGEEYERNQRRRRLK